MTATNIFYNFVGFRYSPPNRKADTTGRRTQPEGGQHRKADNTGRRTTPEGGQHRKADTTGRRTQPEGVTSLEATDSSSSDKNLILILRPG